MVVRCRCWHVVSLSLHFKDSGPDLVASFSVHGAELGEDESDDRFFFL